jgi:hypothetical protein
LHLSLKIRIGLVGRGQVPAPEALARHRIPSVAWPKATTAAKRTQGVDGPQCASVKGLSPVMNRKESLDEVGEFLFVGHTLYMVNF